MIRKDDPEGQPDLPAHRVSMTTTPPSRAAFWDQRYREGSDGWELQRPAPPLERLLRHHPLAPRPPGRVLVPGCGRGHEARLLAELGFAVIGLDFSGEALREARQRHGEDSARLRWVQADLLDPDSLAAAGIDDASFDGVLEHTCFCAIEPEARPSYLRSIKRLLAPDGWLLGLFWCHGRQGGPPFGSDPLRLAADLEGSGLVKELWQEAEDSAPSRDGSPRDGEWLGLWRLPRATELPPLVATSLRPAVALTIGGSDSGGGAGIQADLKTFTALQVHGCSALSCITAQNTLGVDRVDALPPASLTAQVEAVCRDLPVTALKTGMLLNRELIEATAAAIAPLQAARVIDPVMVSRAGAVLLDPEAIEALRNCLLPLASLLTPNLHEARLLSGVEISDPAGMERAARILAALGPAAVMIKGGGLNGLQGTDLLWSDDRPHWLRAAPVATVHSHGSGCTLSAAITAHLAQGLSLPVAVSAAKRFVEGGLRHSLAIGSGQGPLCHWHRQLGADPAAGSASPAHDQHRTG